MASNQMVIKQVQRFIDAGVYRRMDLSPQVDFLVNAQVADIQTDGSLSTAEKAILINELRQQVNARVKQFAPKWDYPPAPQLPEEE